MRKAVLSLAMLCTMLAAQNPPTPNGPPETVLAGIDVHHTTVAAIQKMYGPYDAVYAVPPDPYPQGTKLYKWGRLTMTLKVLTEPNSSSSAEVIRAIEIAGEGEPADKPINKTGRGLKLGAKASEIKKLYGIDATKGSATLQWQDGTTLLITLNNKKRVSKIELRAARK